MSSEREIDCIDRDWYHLQDPNQTSQSLQKKVFEPPGGLPLFELIIFPTISKIVAKKVATLQLLSDSQ
ncbi:MAG: hypothetical protein GQ541_01235 [Desulfovibrionaceae bacterium]|nr:hypothetical protein [Desulfovibrionaceae bacterium]